MLDNLRKYKIILASNSPRRRELLAGLDIDFTVRTMPGVSEDYPVGTPAKDIAPYIAREKADAYAAVMGDDELLITADTVVVADGHALGKPCDDTDARRMLRLLSGRTHQVVTGVCLTTKKMRHSFAVSTEVTFKTLTDDEIDYYVSTYHPTDKAGAYGIQEWIGHIGVTRLEGSYFNVMGLPVQRIYNELQKF